MASVVGGKALVTAPVLRVSEDGDTSAHLPVITLKNKLKLVTYLLFYFYFQAHDYVLYVSVVYYK